MALSAELARDRLRRAACLLGHVPESPRAGDVADEAQSRCGGLGSPRTREPALVQDTQVPHERLERAAEPGRADQGIGRFGRRMDLGDLTPYGLPVPEEGVMSKVRRLGQAPAIVDRVVIDAIKNGRVEIVRGVESFDADTVRLADGELITYSEEWTTVPPNAARPSHAGTTASCS